MVLATSKCRPTGKARLASLRGLTSPRPQLASPEVMGSLEMIRRMVSLHRSDHLPLSRQSLHQLQFTIYGVGFHNRFFHHIFAPWESHRRKRHFEHIELFVHRRSQHSNARQYWISDPDWGDRWAAIRYQHRFTGQNQILGRDLDRGRSPAEQLRSIHLQRHFDNSNSCPTNPYDLSSKATARSREWSPLTRGHGRQLSLSACPLIAA